MKLAILAPAAALLIAGAAVAAETKTPQPATPATPAVPSTAAAPATPPAAGRAPAAPVGRAGAGRGMDKGQFWDKLSAQLDTDKSGTISKTEWVAKQAGFERLDANADGSITADETPSDKPRLERFVQRFDKDADGKVTLEEWKDQRGRAFDRLDTNHDGAVDEAEFVAAKAQRGDGM